jgi:hypothetical protein
MTMKMRNTVSAAAIVAVLACSAADAQVLGGNVGGAVNGALGGGLRDTSVFGNGNAAGSFGGELDTGSMLRTTRGMSEDATRRARGVGANVRNRAQSTIATAHDTGSDVATSAIATASTAKEEQLRNTSAVAASTASVAASAASQLDAIRPSVATAGAVSKSVALEPHQDLEPKLGSVTGDVSGDASGNASVSPSGLVADAAADGSAVANLAAPEKNDVAPIGGATQTDDTPKKDRSIQ